LEDTTFAETRMMRDHILVVCGILNSKQAATVVLCLRASARQKYFSHIDDQKKLRVDEWKNRKRKALAVVRIVCFIPSEKLHGEKSITKVESTHRVQTSANAVRYPKVYPPKSVINIHLQLFQFVI